MNQVREQPAVGTAPPDPKRHHQQRAYSALERLLSRVLEPGYTGDACLKMVVVRGGITAVRRITDEVE